MAYEWYYNGIRITVINLKEVSEQIIAKLQPISGGTIFQTFGYINDEYSLQGYVVGETDKDALKALRDDGVPYTLSGLGQNLGSYYLNKVSIDWTHTYKQTFRLDKDPEDNVYKCSLELSKNA